MPRWFETPAAEIALHPDSPRLAAAIAALGEWSVHTRDSGGGVSIVNGTTAKLRSTRGTQNLTPAASKVPWDTTFKVPTNSTGNHDQIVYIDVADGGRFMVWMPQYPLRVFGLVTVPGVLGCGYAVRVSEPALDRKGRTVPGKPADLRTYRGNDPRCNGAGVIPRPVTRAQLAAGRIAHALSCYLPSNVFGPAGMVVAPAGKVENSGKNLPSVGGVRVSWRFDDADLDQPIGELDPWHRAEAWTLANAMREYGATVDMTGPNPGIVCADIDLPRDSLAGVLDRVEWVVHQPPHGYLQGVDMGTGHGWRDDFRY